METIKVINKRLASKYGLAYDGRPNFRVVFSDTQFETRFDDFEDFCGEIFIRRVREYRECPKYSYIVGKHVLEELHFFEYGDLKDRPFINSAYEPLWTFMDKDHNALYPVWPAVEFAVECKLEGIRRTIKQKVKRDFKAEEKAAQDKEIDDISEMLGMDESSISDMRNQTVNFVKPVFYAGMKPFIVGER